MGNWRLAETAWYMVRHAPFVDDALQKQYDQKGIPSWRPDERMALLREQTPVGDDKFYLLGRMVVEGRPAVLGDLERELKRSSQRVSARIHAINQANPVHYTPEQKVDARVKSLKRMRPAYQL
jgi:hypothetical protein